MASKRYKTAVWVVGTLMAAAFAYYFITVLLFSGTKFFGHQNKLTDKEKAMVEKFESACNCKVRLRHNYELINNTAGNKFTESDSTLSLSFTSKIRNNNTKQGLPLCGYSDTVLIAHAKQVVAGMLQIVSHEDHYKYVTIAYIAYNDRDIQDAGCYKI